MTRSRLGVFVALVVLAESAFYAVVPPLVPGFVRELGTTTPEVGILVAAYPAGVVLAAFPSMVLVDLRGVRSASVAGLAALILATLGFAWAGNPAVLDLARLVQGMGGQLAWTGAMAWLTSEAPLHQRGSRIGGTLGAALIGMVLGPGIGALASTAGRSWIFSAIALGLALIASIAPRSSSAALSRRSSLTTIRALIRSPQARLGTGLLAGIGVVTGTIAALMPFLVTRRGGSPALIAAVLATAYLLGSFLNLFMGRLSDRVGRLVPAMAGFVVAGAVLPTLPQWPTTGTLFTAGVIATGCISSLWTPTAAMVTDGADESHSGQAVAVATLNAGWAVGAAIGAATAAKVADAVGFEVPFYFLGAFCAASVLVLVGARCRSSPAAKLASHRTS